ncbi:MAG: SGNH/GDSL hydrolase family protein [Candidatus Omnitrophica bacterium]|nr:SGNH/GDSL hydrolase family protein [Candidatus Omnitrophota bacterium]
MTDSISGIKKLFFGILTFFLSLVIFLILLEVIFRIFRDPPNPLTAITQIKTNYLFEPNTVLDHQTNQFNEFNYTAHINSHGYRGEEYIVPKPSDEKRIMVIGDSFTFGVGANDDETIPVLLEQYLKKSDFRINVINGGAGHASPIYHYVNLENFHLKAQPDLVVLMMDLTDIQDDWRHERQAVFDENGKIKYFDQTYVDGKRSWWKWLIFYSASWAQFDRKVLRAFEKKQLLGRDKYTHITDKKMRVKGYIANTPDGTYPDDVILQYDGLLFMRGKLRERLIRKQFERTAKYLDQIKALLDKEGIPMLLVIYPYGIYVGADEWNEGRFTWGFDKDKLYTDYFPFELVAEYAKKRDMPFLNITPNLISARRLSPEPFYFKWDGHMTPAANRVAAQEISAFLLKTKIIPARN